MASFDLIVATVGRVDELRRLFASLERQTNQDFRVLVVDQNDDDRISGVLDAQPFEIVRLTSPPGLSHARNAGLQEANGEFVAFPDDDCVYPDDLLERVAVRFARDARLDGLSGRADTSASWVQTPAILTRENIWNRAISYGIFLRRSSIEQVGMFDERLGLPLSSGEEIDYLIRAVDLGARIEYDPTLVVHHAPEARSRIELAARDGASIGYILRKHRFPPQTLARMLVRPVGGAVLACLKNDRQQAGFHVVTLRGRLRGYRRATPSR